MQMEIRGLWLAEEAPRSDAGAMMKSLLSIVPGVVVIGTSAAIADDTPMTIKSNLQVGKKYTYEMNMNQSMQTEAAGQPIDQDMKMMMKYASSVSAAEGGKKSMASEYLDASMSMNMKMNGEKMDIPGIGDAMDALKGQKFTALLDENDKFLKVEGVKELLDTVGDNPQTKQMMQGILSEDNMKQMFNQSTLAAFPENPVKPGDSWTFEIPLPLGQMGKGSMTGTYTYNGREEFEGKACAKIKLSGKIAMDFDADEADEEQPPEVKQALEMMKALGMKIETSNVEGILHFDPSVGAVRSMNTNQNFTMTMKNPADGSSIRMPIKQKVTLKLSGFDDIAE